MRTKQPTVAAFLIILGLCSTRGPVQGSQKSSKPVGDDRTTFEPTANYEPRVIEGWPILVNKGLLANKAELAGKTLDLLKFQLYQIERVVPATAVEKLKSIKIWVEENEPHHPCMVYHPDPVWLTDHGMNPDKARCLEIANANRFLDWTREQPWMVFHELAHGYHHQFLEGGHANSEIKALYDDAMKSHRYDSVLRIGGRMEKAYAASNPAEYFAEASEAFFGVNDWFPFVRPELAKHDPKLSRLVARVWGAQAGNDATPKPRKTQKRR